MMRWWIIICLSLASCNPQIVTQIKEIVIHDSIFNTDIIYRDTFLEIESVNPKRVESGSRTEARIVVKRETNTVVKTVYGEPGMLLYDIPDSMILSKLYTIKVRSQKQVSSISKDGTRKSVQAPIQTSRNMEVDLSDPDPEGAFKISKVNSNQQIVESDYYTEWIFNVIPTKSGNRSLNLVVSIISNDGVKQIVHEDIIFVKNKISVKIESFWEKHWQWVFTTILIPIFIYIWKKKQQKSKASE